MENLQGNLRKLTRAIFWAVHSCVPRVLGVIAISIYKKDFENIYINRELIGLIGHLGHIRHCGTIILDKISSNVRFSGESTWEIVGF
jgi:hypothetical protein